VTTACLTELISSTHRVSQSLMSVWEWLIFLLWIILYNDQL
jgi:hypothetical protein